MATRKPLKLFPQSLLDGERVLPKNDSLCARPAGARRKLVKTVIQVSKTLLLLRGQSVEFIQALLQPRARWLGCRPSSALWRWSADKVSNSSMGVFGFLGSAAF